MLDWIKKHPDRITHLALHARSMDDLLRLPMAIFPVTPRELHEIGRLTTAYHLLTNDALIVAVMQHHGLAHLASNDADFDRVPGLTRYAPA